MKHICLKSLSIILLLTADQSFGDAFSSGSKKAALPLMSDRNTSGQTSKIKNGSTNISTNWSSKGYTSTDAIYKAMVEVGQNDAINVMQGGEASEMFKKVREIVEKQTGIPFRDDMEAAVFIIESLD